MHTPISALAFLVPSPPRTPTLSSASDLQPCPDALLDDGLLDITYLLGNPGSTVSGLVSMLGMVRTASTLGRPYLLVLLLWSLLWLCLCL